MDRGVIGSWQFCGGPLQLIIPRHCGSRGGGVGGQGLRSAGQGSGQRGAREGRGGGRQWQGSFQYQVMKESSKGVVIGDRKPGKEGTYRHRSSRVAMLTSAAVEQANTETSCPATWSPWGAKSKIPLQNFGLSSL